MRFDVLGPLQISTPDGPIPLGGLTQRAALGFLLLHVNEVVPTSSLIDALWPQRPPTTSRKVLQNAITGLRQVLHHPTRGDVAHLATRRPGYVLEADPDRLDLYEFRRLSERGRELLTGERFGEAADMLARAESLWRGSVLADLQDAGLSWPAMATVEADRLDTLELLAGALLSNDEPGRVVSALSPLAAGGILREGLAGQLMLAFYRSGRQNEALAVFRRTRDRLRDELGLEPGRGLRELEAGILAHEPGLLAPRGGPALSPAPAAGRVTAGRPAPADDDPACSDRPVRHMVTLLIIQASEALPGPADRPGLALRQLDGVVEANVRERGGVLLGRIGAIWAAAFGVPRAHGDDAERATRAALAIDAATQAAGLPPPVQALVSDWVTVPWPAPADSPGSSEPSEPGPAAGPGPQAVAVAVLDLSQRGLALLDRPPSPDRIWMGPVTAQRVSATFAAGLEPAGFVAGAMPVRPISGGARSLPAASGDVQHTKPPFRGREYEIDLLRSLIRDGIARRRVRLATLLGQPGLGRSRVIEELSREVGADSDQDVLVLRSRPGAEVSDVPAATQIAAGLLGLPPGSLDPEVAPTAVQSALTRVLGRSSMTGWLSAHLTPVLLGERPEGTAGDAWRQALLEAAARRPLVVVVEDAHLAAPTLLDQLEELADDPSRVPLAIVVTGTQELFERRPAWGAGRRDTLTLTLAPLPDVVIEQILSALEKTAGGAGQVAAGGAGQVATPSPDDIAEIGGNPLFAVEVARARLTPAGLRRERGEPPLPVAGLIAARLDALDDDLRALLGVASVLGRTVWAGALSAMTGTDLWSVLPQLQRLERYELLHRVRPESLPGEVEYRFAHGWEQLVAYESLCCRRRSELHQLAFGWCERLPGEWAGLLAHHAERTLFRPAPCGCREAPPEEAPPPADFVREAANALVEAGRRAEAAGATAAAARAYDQAARMDHPRRAHAQSALGRLTRSQ